MTKSQATILQTDLMPFSALGVDAETYLKALLAGEAPTPHVLGGQLFFLRSEVSRWRYRLSAYAADRYSELLSQEAPNG